MGEVERRVDEVRKRSGELENHLIDEYRAGRISRREFIRRGTVVGMAIPALSFLAAACGGDGGGEAAPPAEPPPPPADTGAAPPPPPPAEPPAATGGTIRSAFNAPTGAVDPLTVADEGGLSVLGQAGEYLAWSDQDLLLQPRVAESWTPNEDASVWTFTIRQGVTFHDGTPLTAEDVASTMNVHADPENGSPGLSALGGVLSPGNARALDERTVEFTLDAPNGSFPYLVSSDNYNAIILPAGHDYGTSYERSFNGTGPWILESFSPGELAVFRRNDGYWDAARVPKADASEIKLIQDEQARVLAFQGGEVDFITSMSAIGGAAIVSDPNVNLIEVESVEHRQVHMRADMEPFTDKRVRQAIALSLDRPAIIDGLFNGKAIVGNDSPFAPVYPATDPSVPQRAQDLELARQLLADAGMGDGFGVELRTHDGVEIPDLAVLIQNAAKEIGVDVTLNVTDAGTYYGDAVFGSSPWLDSAFGITDYGHRGVPNVLLTAPLTSEGPWNSAHFTNAAYDDLVAQYVAAIDLDSQRALAKQIQELLLDETPIVFPYFFTRLAAQAQTLTGVLVTGMGHVDLAGAAFTA